MTGRNLRGTRVARRTSEQGKDLSRTSTQPTADVIWGEKPRSFSGRGHWSRATGATTHPASFACLLTYALVSRWSAPLLHAAASSFAASVLFEDPSSPTRMLMEAFHPSATSSPTPLPTRRLPARCWAYTSLPKPHLDTRKFESSLRLETAEQEWEATTITANIAWSRGTTIPYLIVSSGLPQSFWWPVAKHTTEIIIGSKKFSRTASHRRTFVTWFPSVSLKYPSWVL